MKSFADWPNEARIPAGGFFFLAALGMLVLGMCLVAASEIWYRFPFRRV